VRCPPICETPTIAAHAPRHGEGYRYPHDAPSGWVDQHYRPDALEDHVYYEPSEHATSATSPLVSIAREGLTSPDKAWCVRPRAAVVVLGPLLLSVPAGAAAPARTDLPGTRPPLPAGAHVTGSVPSAVDVSADVVLEPRDPAALAAAVSAVSTPGSPTYQQFLAPASSARSTAPLRPPFRPSAPGSHPKASMSGRPRPTAS